MPITEVLDAMLQSVIATELRRRSGWQQASIEALFDAIDEATVQAAKPWSWLHTAEARNQVPCLLLIPGAAYLTPFADAKLWLGHPEAVVIDVASFIREIEDRTGRCFETGSLAVDAQFDGFRTRLAALDADDDQPF